MNQNGHIKGTTEDDNGFRQFIVNCIGSNDQRKYFSIASFGSDFNAPDNTRVLTTDSRNKDESYTLGVLNDFQITDLKKGESVSFSTNETGTELKGYIKFRNDGTMEQNGDVDFLAGFTKLKEGFDKLKEDLNNLISSYNSHIHITTATVGATPAPGVITATTSAGNPSTASIDDAKKENLKTE